jgi:hypothetical protein
MSDPARTFVSLEGQALSALHGMAIGRDGLDIVMVGRVHVAAATADSAMRARWRLAGSFPTCGQKCYNSNQKG